MKISALLITADRICDYIPFVSTLSNLTNLFLRCIPPSWLPSEVAKSRYWRHIQTKDLIWSLFLLIPIANIGLMVGSRCIDRAYRNNVKSQELDKEAPQNFDSEREGLAGRQGASENRNSGEKPMPPKPDSPRCVDTYTKEMQQLTAVNLQQKREIEELLQESRRLEQELRKELGVNNELKDLDQLLSERKAKLKGLIETLRATQREAKDEIKRLEEL